MTDIVSEPFQILFSYLRTLSPSSPWGPGGPITPVSPWGTQSGGVRSQKNSNIYLSIKFLYIFTNNQYFLLPLLPLYTTSYDNTVWHVCGILIEICFRLTLCPLSPGKPGRPSKPRSPWERHKDICKVLLLCCRRPSKTWFNHTPV